MYPDLKIGVLRRECINRPTLPFYPFPAEFFKKYAKPVRKNERIQPHFLVMDRPLKTACAFDNSTLCRKVNEPVLFLW